MSKGDIVKPPIVRHPVTCIIGDACTGKTMLLGCIRGNPNFPKNPSTRFPPSRLYSSDAQRRMLVVDKAAFNGLALCDLAIFVVDIMKDDGCLLPQDSLNLLKLTNKQFIVVLNKIDMIHDWKTCPNSPIRKVLLQQSKVVQDEFHIRVSKVVSQFKTHGLNTQLYYENNKTTIQGQQTFTIVPTSARTGEGIPDLLFLLFKWNQKTMIHKFTYSEYVQNLKHDIFQPRLSSVVKPNHHLYYLQKEASQNVDSILSTIDISVEGVYVKASALCCLKELLDILIATEIKVPVSAINIGPVLKEDVKKASAMLPNKQKYAAILAYRVKVTPEATELADKLGVEILTSNKAYHLFNLFINYMHNIKYQKKKESAYEACVLKIMPNFVINNKDPIVLGVDIIQGILMIGNSICIPSQKNIDIGRIASIEHNLKPVYIAEKGQQVVIKIDGRNFEERQKMFGRHFGIDDVLESHIIREAGEAIEDYYNET